MTINGWSESKEDAAMRWEKTQAAWYAACQLKASEITEVEAIELEAALRNAALLDAETVTDLTRAAYGLGRENLGTHMIISGGEVVELDNHLEASYEERTEEDMPF